MGCPDPQWPLVRQAELKGCKATFHIRYLPGTLEAAALDENGKELGRGKLISCAGKLSIALSPEKKAVRPGGVVYIPLAIRGENGEVESRADRTVGVTVEGGRCWASVPPTPAPRSGSTPGGIPPITAGR